MTDALNIALARMETLGAEIQDHADTMKPYYLNAFRGESGIFCQSDPAPDSLDAAIEEIIDMQWRGFEHVGTFKSGSEIDIKLMVQERLCDIAADMEHDRENREDYRRKAL